MHSLQSQQVEVRLLKTKGMGIQSPESASSSGEEGPGIIDLELPSFECCFGSLKEGITEWGSEVSTKFDWFSLI